MSKIVGYRKTVLSFSDGTTCPYYYLHFEDKENGVEGVTAFNAGISEARLNGYVPKVGDSVIIGWSRYKAGKVDSVTKAM